MSLRNNAFSANQRRREKEAEKEERLRQKIHNTVDVMTLGQLEKLADSLNFGREFEEKIPNERLLLAGI